MSIPMPLLLNYAPVKRRRPLRNIACLTGLLAVAFLAFRYGPAARARADLLLAQRRCLEFSPPAGTTAFDETRSNPPIPRPLAGFAKITGLLRRYHDPNCINTAIVVFSHRLRNNLGERLVVLGAWDDYGGEGCTMTGGITFSAEVFSLATLSKLPTRLNAMEVDPPESPPTNTTLVRAQLPGRVTIDFGQADACDPSAFEFTYHVGNLKGTIRGRLTNNDTIELRDLSKDGIWNNVRPVYWPIENQ